MVFSFTGDKYGRVLQAHMDCDSLVIRKSKFYDFRSRNDAHLELFLQYMACGLQGETTILDFPTFRSKIAQEKSPA